MISSDPAFASEVLTVSNSLLYAPRYSSTTIEQAVAALGENTLKGMCVTVGVRAYLGNAMSYPAMRNMWRHNLACAMISEANCGGWIDRQRYRIHGGYLARRRARGVGGDSTKGLRGAAG
ncbi:MAG: HDOD domain-containing protein [Terracidiphilus sp.]